MTAKANPIAVFDSGVGGISVLRELMALLPKENFLYFGDSLNAPYGTKTSEQVLELTKKHVDSLIRRGAKAVVIACNTATSAAADELRSIYTTPIIGIEPALKPAVFSGEHPRVLVMATPMTLSLDKFNRLLAKYHSFGDVYLLPCPGLAEAVESGDLNSAKTEALLTGLLKDYIAKPIDSVVLGCTHYPFVRPLIRRLLGDSVEIIDGSEGTARELKRRLIEADLLNPSSENGSVVFENSRNTVGELELCRRLFSSKY